MKTIDKIFYYEIGKILNQKRRERGCSLRYLSKLTGISSTTLDNYELGISRINIKNFEIICECLGIQPKIDISINIGNTKITP